MYVHVATVVTCVCPLVFYSSVTGSSLPWTQLTGAGPIQYAQLIQQTDKPSGQDQQHNVGAGILGAVPTQKPTTTPTATSIAPGGIKGEVPLLETAEVVAKAEQPRAKAPKAVAPPVAKVSPGATPSKTAAMGIRLDSETVKRLSSETHRLLLSHQVGAG